jgi:hypothetical protein
MTEELIEIRTHGSYDKKALEGRIYIVRPSEFPEGRTIALGDFIIHKGVRRRVRGMDLPRTADNLIGLILEDE